MNPSSITSSVEENSRKHELDLRLAEKRLSEAHEKTLELEHSILEGLREVASIQLENPDAFSKDVARELNQRRDEEAKLRQDLQNVEVSIGSLNEMATELAGRIENLTADVNRALAVDANYLGLIQAQEKAGLQLTAYTSQEVEIATECRTKLAEFQKSAVFTYLLNSKYGTDEYKGRFLVRALDSWLAAKIGFLLNASNYRMLLAMQEANQTRHADLKREAEVAEEMVKAAANRSYDAAGLLAMQSRLLSVRDKITKHKQSANWFHTSLGKFALRTDDHSKKAQELILSSLRTRSFDEIKALVKQSTSVADDQAAARVAVLQRELANHHQALPELEHARDNAQLHYNRAKDLERAMRSHRYTSSSYQYDQGLNLDLLILGYMAGNVQLPVFESTVQRHQVAAALPESWSTSSSIGGGGGDTFSISDALGSVADSVSTSDSF